MRESGVSAIEGTTIARRACVERSPGAADERNAHPYRFLTLDRIR